MVSVAHVTGASSSPHEYSLMCFQLTLVRHGETEENRLGIIQGQSDTLLNESGKQQARRVGQRLSCENFTRVFSSDLSRAKDTADTIVAHLQEKKEIITDGRLRERRFGVSEGTSVSDLIRSAHESKIPVVTYTPQGGETVEQLSRRAREFLNELCSDMFSPLPSETPSRQSKTSIIISQYIMDNDTTVMHLPTAHVLVVTHGGFIRSLLNNLKNQCGCIIAHRSMSSPNTGVTSLLVSLRQEKKREGQKETEQISRTKCVSVTALCVNDIRHLK